MHELYTYNISIHKYKCNIIPNQTQTYLNEIFIFAYSDDIYMDGQHKNDDILHYFTMKYNVWCIFHKTIVCTGRGGSINKLCVFSRLRNRRTRGNALLFVSSLCVCFFLVCFLLFALFLFFLFLFFWFSFCKSIGIGIGTNIGMH